MYEINSTASESNASFTIVFDFKKDMSEAGDEINAIASVRYKLPVEMRAGSVPPRHQRASSI